MHALARVAVLAGLFLPGAPAFAASEVADAAMRGDRDALRALIARRADVNAPQPDGATALHWAVYRGDIPAVDLLLGVGARVNATNREGATVLSLAAMNGDAALLARLLAAGANANERLPNDETPLMLAARSGRVDALQVLTGTGADVNAAEKLRGTTALMWAAEQGHPDAVRFLLEHGADANTQSAVVAQRSARPNVAPNSTQRVVQVEQQAAGTLGRRAAPPAPKVGQMTAMHFAARQRDLESAKLLLAAGASINAVTVDGWTPLLIATQNRHYRLGAYLLEHGADPNLANGKGWTNLYLATDNRNIEGGEYPVPQADMDHLDYIRLLLDHSASVNQRIADYTETRTNFTMQWLNEDGATAFLRAAQSSDVALMKLLLARGADPKLSTRNNTNALMVAAGVGWVEGVTFEWSDQDNVEAVRLLLDLGLNVNLADGDGRTALHGAAHKGRNAVVQLLVERGAKLDARDHGSRDTLTGELSGRTWMPVDYADGLVRVGVQSAIPHPETAVLLRRLMNEHGLQVPEASGATVCVVDLCQ
jgi:uncharacterized protein